VRRSRNPQRCQASQLDVDGIEPHDVVRQRRRAQQPQLRAHDARHHQHTQRSVGHGRALRTARQRRERPILGGAEVGQQFAPALPAREPQPDLFIAPREAVVRGDVIER
jgi:hypothetical protein